jgi:hypothetical protein
MNTKLIFVFGVFIFTIMIAAYVFISQSEDDDGDEDDEDDEDDDGDEGAGVEEGVGDQLIIYKPITVGDKTYQKSLYRNTADAECSDGYEYDGTKCIIEASDYESDVSSIICPEKYAYDGTLKKCTKESASYTEWSKLANCPSGYTMNGATCGRGSDDIYTPSILKDCPDGYKNSGFGTCIPRIKGVGVGKLGSSVNYYKCPPGYTHWGSSGSGACRKTQKNFLWEFGDTAFNLNDARMRCYKYYYGQPGPDYVSKWANMNINHPGQRGHLLNPNNSHSKVCYKPSGSEWISPKCPSGGRNDGLNCWKNEIPVRKSEYINYEKCGALYFPKCPSGMYKSTCEICSTKGPITRTDFKNCPSGYNPHTVGRCKKNCPAGYSSTGETCHKPVSTLGMGSMTCPSGYFKSGARCYKTCKPGYTNTGEQCIAGSDTVDKAVATCKSGSVAYDGKCYESCKTGFTFDETEKKCIQAEQTRPSSSMVCSGGFEKIGNACYEKCPTDWTASKDGTMCLK